MEEPEPQILASLGIGVANANQTDTFTLSDLGYTLEEWNEMSEKERDEAVQSYVDEWSQNYIELYWRFR